MFTLIIDEDITPKKVSAQDIEDILLKVMKYEKNPRLHLIKPGPTLRTVLEAIIEENPIQGVHKKIEEYHKDGKLLKIHCSSEKKSFVFEFTPLSDTVYFYPTTRM